MKSKSKKRGFTLIEVVIAIALGGLIVLATSSLFISITQLWVKSEELDSFQGHIHGVNTFLKKHFKESYFKLNDKLPSLEWAKPPRVSLSGDETLLSFFVRTPNPLFPINSPYPVVAYLKIDKDKGLSIIWHSFEKPEGTKEQAIFQTEISPWAKAFKLHYYNKDKNSWEILDKPKKATEGKANKQDLPDFLEIQFEKEGEGDFSTFIPLFPDYKGKDKGKEQNAQRQ